MDLNDELLCAYLDNELDAEQRQRVAAALAADAGAQLRLQRMRDADIDLFLVGESFMRDPDPGAALRRLFFPS